MRCPCTNTRLFCSRAELASSTRWTPSGWSTKTASPSSLRKIRRRTRTRTRTRSSQPSRVRRQTYSSWCLTSPPSQGSAGNGFWWQLAKTCRKYLSELIWSVIELQYCTAMHSQMCNSTCSLTDTAFFSCLFLWCNTTFSSNRRHPEFTGSIKVLCCHNRDDYKRHKLAASCTLSFDRPGGFTFA
eukprot:1397721-Pleurochrysis_carterae.AAC.1